MFHSLHFLLFKWLKSRCLKSLLTAICSLVVDVGTVDPAENESPAHSLPWPLLFPSLKIIDISVIAYYSVHAMSQPA